MRQELTMTHATLCFLIRGNPPSEILLGLKKVGLGEGKYGGFGGKIEAGETVTMAAVRELEEETGVKVLEKDLQRMAHLTFLFPAKPDWSQVVHVFLATKWDGDPVESSEMIPAWFAIANIPFEQMWQDVYHWLPCVLAGDQVRASFTFKEDNETVDEVRIEPWDGGEE
jgi:8-oxo-dGTP pyrophosphatase MutT (NUDIX family)